jgi:exopolysaccharide biosynthesis WecB/TagA/CpsF family protein
MRVLVLHNRYRQSGGEDRAVAAEIAMLRAHGVDVVYHEADNNGGLVQLATNSAWSDASFRTISKLCREVRPDIAHVHNFWATLSPSVHAACHAEGVPTVQTLHNYRLFCVNGVFLRNGKVCTDCLGVGPWRGVAHRCYNHSAIASAAVARMISSNRRSKTWTNVDAFIAPSEHARSMFVAGGIDAERLHVKPNFTTDPGLPPSRPSVSRAIVYAGRLSQEKGVRTLLAAWARGGLREYGELVIIGDGPEAEHLPHDVPGVRFLGCQEAPAVTEAMGNARAVVVPSVCFETFGNTVVEGFACGRPVIASDIGALGDLVDHECTGLKFPAADETALGDALRRILTDPDLANRLGDNARAEYLKRFTRERNFEMLNGIYERVLRSQTQVGRPVLLKRPIVGVNVAATSYAEVCKLCRDWIDARDPRAHSIALLTVHSVMTAVFHKDLRHVLNETDIAAPDGMPLAWALRSHGIRRQPRVYGPDLMLALCEQAASLGHRIFLYGGRDEVLDTLQRNLRARYPGLDIADAYAPPFRPLTPEEDRAVVERIRESVANIVFVGIGAPKQERWMASHREKLPGVVMLGVGAAFDFHAGRVKQAPRWMQRSGLEWFFRLVMEPRRLWKRYMLNPLFLAMWLLELVGIRLVTAR